MAVVGFNALIRGFLAARICLFEIDKSIAEWKLKDFVYAGGQLRVLFRVRYSSIVITGHSGQYSRLIVSSSSSRGTPEFAKVVV